MFTYNVKKSDYFKPMFVVEASEMGIPPQTSKAGFYAISPWTGEKILYTLSEVCTDKKEGETLAWVYTSEATTAEFHIIND